MPLILQSNCQERLQSLLNYHLRSYRDSQHSAQSSSQSKANKPMTRRRKKILTKYRWPRTHLLPHHHYYLFSLYHPQTTQSYAQYVRRRSQPPQLARLDSCTVTLAYTSGSRECINDKKSLWLIKPVNGRAVKVDVPSPDDVCSEAPRD